ncbi:Protein of unknown function [Paraoerskovia marina]|uniref:DUF3515 domain-containing protein n=1 Tax=Paraoerskovia marina TaxID=545619 RepID=A0A1H1RJJ4_9CELL|nr:DUF3515 family protein [Paraoerskovia marina]SDS35823.1 Protein of unknown function [Paraoerskovia marina]
MHAHHPVARPSRRSAAAVLLVATSGVVLTGCAPTIGVPAAEDATDPVCASIVLSVPDELAGLPQVPTNSQATTAWGEPGAAITLRCGVEPPGPTAEAPCLTVESSSGDVDWLAAPDDEGTWTFVTYGRDPAVEVQVPPAITEDRSTSFVADLNRAVSEAPATRTCVGLEDVKTAAPDAEE